MLYKTAFTKHPYHWPTIGWMPDILGFTPEDCAGFYKTYYAPNNAILVVVGDVREADVLREVRDHYGKLAASVIPPEDCEPEPPQKDVREVEIKKPTATEKLLVGYHGPALGMRTRRLTILHRDSDSAVPGVAGRIALVIEKEIASDGARPGGDVQGPGALRALRHRARARGTTRASCSTRSTRELERSAARRGHRGRAPRLEAKARTSKLSALQSLESTSGKAEQIGFYELILGDPGAIFRRLETYRR